jgi:hypothetical protein
VRVTRVEWRHRRYATRLHPDGEYRVWRLEVDLAAGAPFLPVYVARSPDAVAAARTWRSTAGFDLTVVARVDPYSWPESDEVRLGLGGCAVAVRAEALKRDPVLFASVHVTPRAALTTGAAWPLVSFPDHGVHLDLALVAKRDTAAARGRWRLAPEHRDALPEPYAFLATGRTTAG